MRVHKMWSGLTFRAVATLYLTLDGALLLRTVLSSPAAEGLGQQAFWVLVDAFLLYRIARGTKGAWLVMLLLTALPIALLPFVFVTIPLLLALAICLLQLALLLHPTIRRRAGIGQHPAPTRAGGSA